MLSDNHLVHALLHDWAPLGHPPGQFEVFQGSDWFSDQWARRREQVLALERPMFTKLL